MFKRLYIFGMAVVISALMVSAAMPYEELTPKFNRINCNSMVRHISVPTLANLDYAAYNANPVLFEPEKFKPKSPEVSPKVSDISFNGVLSNVVNTIEETPLTDTEKSNPMAWKPLVKKLWDVAKDQSLKSIAGKISGYKWADPSVYMPYQTVTTAYVHNNNGSKELWVKVEFSYWVKFLDAVNDEDSDGIKEIYGKLNIDDVDKDVLTKSFNWIENDYLVKKVDRQGVIDWITDLASYWYPTKNSDIVDPEETAVWPNKDTKDFRRVKKFMKKVTVKNPIAVVEAKPFDPAHPIYNVYIVDGLEKVKKKKSSGAVIVNKKMDTSVSKNFKENNKRFKSELKQYGSYEKWNEKMEPYLGSLKKILSSLPNGGMSGNGIEGKDDFVFFSKSLIYSTAGDLSKQPDEKNPLVHLKELKKALDEHNVNFLFIPIPTKSEVYFDKLGSNAPSSTTAIVNPYSRKILKDIQDAGIEVIDLLPRFLEAKKDDEKAGEPVYQKQDTHWTNRGLQIATNLIVERIKQYNWYKDAERHGINYSIVDTTFTRQGDIVDKLPENLATKYPAVTIKAQQVRNPDGKLKKRSISGPILLMGDSFTGVFELVDCKGAGLVSHITAKTGCNVGHIISWGGGPLVIGKLGKKLDKILGPKRLVIYVMVARDLYNYREPWPSINVKK